MGFILLLAIVTMTFLILGGLLAAEHAWFKARRISYTKYSRGYKYVFSRFYKFDNDK